MPHFFFNPAPMSSIRVGFGPWCFLFTVSLAKWRSMRTRFDWWLEKTCFFFVQPLCWQTKIQLHISKGCLSRTFQPQNQQKSLPRGHIFGSPFILFHNTPWKINMEPINPPFRKENDQSSKPPWLCSMLIFRGVSNLSYLGDFSRFAPPFKGRSSRGCGVISEVRNVGLNWEDLSWIVEEYNSLKAWGEKKVMEDPMIGMEILGRDVLLFLIFECIMVLNYVYVFTNLILTIWSIHIHWYSLCNIYIYTYLILTLYIYIHHNTTLSNADVCML